jgi:hypothetical protein
VNRGDEAKDDCDEPMRIGRVTYYYPTKDVNGFFEVTLVGCYQAVICGRPI